MKSFDCQQYWVIFVYTNSPKWWITKINIKVFLSALLRLLMSCHNMKSDCLKNKITKADQNTFYHPWKVFKKRFAFFTDVMSGELSFLPVSFKDQMLDRNCSELRSSLNRHGLSKLNDEKCLIKYQISESIFFLHHFDELV